MPIVTDKTFKAALKKILEDEPSYKRAGGSEQDWPSWSYAVAKYYAPEIERANLALEGLRDNRPNRIKTAFNSKVKRRSLLGALGARLEYYAWEYHCSLGNRNYEVKPNPAQRDVSKLHTGDHRNSMSMHALKKCTDQFISYITEVVTRVNTDWNHIKQIFFPNWELVELHQIGMTGSDSHKKGKSVLILVFKGRQPPQNQGNAISNAFANIFTKRPTSLLRLVYKPSDMALDYLMVGNTQRVAAANPGGLPNSPGGSLLENLNTLIQGNQINANQTFTDANRPDPVLPVYPILPRNRGNITNAYGYIMFLTCLPKPSDDLAHVVVPQNMADSDWITNQTNALIDYYRIFGWYIAIGLNFGLADAHNQNLIVHKKKPYLIDLEISFKERCESVGNTGLGDAMTRGYGQKDGDKNHMFYLDGGVVKWTTGAKAAGYINNAISEALDLIRRDPTGSLQAWLEGQHLAGTVARYTPRATADFGGVLRTLYSSSKIRGANNLAYALANATNQPAASPDGGFAYDAGAKRWYEGAESKHKPNFVLNDDPHDFADYLNCDYPAYYRRLNSMHLINARGQDVDVGQPEQTYQELGARRNRTIAGTRYFDHYPAIHLFDIDLGVLRLSIDLRTYLFNISLRELKFSVDLSRLTIPESEPQAQVTADHLDDHLVADLRGTFTAHRINLTEGAQAVTVTNGSHWQIINGEKAYDLELQANSTRVSVYTMLTVPESAPAVPVTPAHLDAHVATDLAPGFASATPAINLSEGTVGAAITNGSQWRINDADHVYYIQLERNTLKVYESVLAIPNTNPPVPVTPPHLDQHLIADLTPRLPDSDPAINLTGGAAASVMTNGKEWRINDGDTTYYIELVSDYPHERLRVYESRLSVPDSNPAVPLTPDHLNQHLIADLTDSFAQIPHPGINLTHNARAETQKDDEQWRINDGDNIYFIERFSDTLQARVFKPGTAIEMVQTQYARLKNSVAFRQQLETDAHAYVNRKYPRNDVNPLFNNF